MGKNKSLAIWQTIMRKFSFSECTLEMRQGVKKWQVPSPFPKAKAAHNYPNTGGLNAAIGLFLLRNIEVMYCVSNIKPLNNSSTGFLSTVWFSIA